MQSILSESQEIGLVPEDEEGIFAGGGWVQEMRDVQSDTFFLASY